MKNKTFACVMGLVLALSLTACGEEEVIVENTNEEVTQEVQTQEVAEAPAETTAEAAGAASDKTYKIGICQLVQHEALDAATQGFKDAIVEALGEDAVTFDEQNAQGCRAFLRNFLRGAEEDLLLR